VEGLHSQLLNVHNVSDIRHIEVHTAEQLVPGSSRLEVEIAIAKLKKYKSPGSDQLPAELTQAGGEILLSAIHKLITSVWNKEVCTKRVTKLTVTIIVGYPCCQFHKNVYRISFSQETAIFSVNVINRWIFTTERV
jgi:hypothetical protein